MFVGKGDKNKINMGYNSYDTRKRYSTKTVTYEIVKYLVLSFQQIDYIAFFLLLHRSMHKLFYR